MNILDVMKDLVPVSRFGQGETKEIFAEVERDGMKVVTKQNKPICVMLSVKEYERIIGKGVK